MHSIGYRVVVLSPGTRQLKEQCGWTCYHQGHKICSPEKQNCAEWVTSRRCLEWGKENRNPASKKLYPRNRTQEPILFRKTTAAMTCFCFWFGHEFIYVQALQRHKSLILWYIQPKVLIENKARIVLENSEPLVMQGCSSPGGGSRSEPRTFSLAQQYPSPAIPGTPVQTSVHLNCI